MADATNNHAPSRGKMKRAASSVSDPAFKLDLGFCPEKEYFRKILHMAKTEGKLVINDATEQYIRQVLEAYETPGTTIHASYAARHAAFEACCIHLEGKLKQDKNYEDVLLKLRQL